MWTTIKLGLRNLSRRRLRSALTWLMILFGTGLMVFSVGLAEGTYADMIRIATRSFTGHFQVLARGYNDKPSLFKAVDDPAGVEKGLLALDRVAAVTGRVETAGLLAGGNRTVGVMLVGVDPEKEKRVTTLDRAVDRGTWLDGSSAGRHRPILLGEGVAQRLEVGLGDEVSFIGQAADGSIAAELYSVTGILKTGADELDGSAALIRLEDAQELLVLQGRVHRVVGVAESIDQLEAAARNYTPPAGLEFLTWSELSPELDKSIKSDRQGTWIGFVIILAVVLLGVTNTMLMSVMERTKEFGVMKALGTSPARLIAIIMGETAWLTLIGVVLGIGLGVAGNYLTTIWGIPMGGGPVSFGGVTIEYMHAENTIRGNIIFPIWIFLSGLLAGLIPALRAARLNPAEAIRQS